MTSNLFRFLNFKQRFMRFTELTTFNPTIPTWDCVSLRVHRTSQKIARKDLQEEMNEEFEIIITVTISLAATAKRKQLSNCHRQTSFQCSHAKHVTSRNSASRIWEGGKKFFHAVRWNIYEIQLALDCIFCNYLKKRVTFPLVSMKTSSMKLLALNLPTDAPFLLEGRCAFFFYYICRL